MEFIIIQVGYSQQMGTKAIKKTVTHNSQEEGSRPHQRGHTGKHLHWAEDVIVISTESKIVWVDLGLATLNDFNRVWGTELFLFV